MDEKQSQTFTDLVDKLLENVTFADSVVEYANQQLEKEGSPKGLNKLMPYLAAYYPYTPVSSARELVALGYYLAKYELD